MYVCKTLSTLPLTSCYSLSTSPVTHTTSYAILNVSNISNLGLTPTVILNTMTVRKGNTSCYN